MLSIRTDSVAQTEELGKVLAGSFQGGENIALTGELGAGKTVLVRGMARGLGIPEPITSPTFVLVKSYHGRLDLYHMDFYRLESFWDLESIGFEDYLESGGVLAMEWAEKFIDEMPNPFLHIRIYYNEGSGRVIEMDTPGAPQWEKNLEGLLHDFLNV